ncbi:MAG TPA: methionyl-tRNA formyltransferase [Acidimicrobiales bacterium]|nr:methionyl-tRNA formyltransferase [Acidimicrobiales bacterium]
MARLAYLGTPQMAVPPLRALVEAGHDIVLCVTRPDRRRGRGGQTTPNPVKEAALRLGIPVSQQMNDLIGVDAELAVVVAFGRIIPSSVLNELPMVNVHFSLLPRWRGAAPVERAILAGDAETGVSLMKVAEGLDTGDVYAVRRVPVDADITLTDLRARLVDTACDLLVDTLKDGLKGLPEAVPQRGDVTMAEKITKEDLHLDWTEPAEQLHRVVRLEHAWTTFRGRRLGVLEAQVGETQPDHNHVAPGTLVGSSVVTGAGILELRRVQPESRSPMSADEWLRGVRPAVNERLGTD